MTDPRHSPLNTGEIRAWWEAAARSANTPTPHWTIPALCDEVDRLRAENAALTAENTRLMEEARP